ncbi:hypothetical protein SAMN04515666_101321 [Bosea lupini]|uniref:Uncharacterized protein n=1 Tax=Bosea lupini TaxID=1036779 RepID=A0A1H7GCZ6_9HYPH|nr:hypothetical protein [Bosea lupini]SEK35998.1 hypothetical protein SAMN04515666_101321 [Bosea lupini]
MSSTDPIGLFERAAKIRLPIKEWAEKSGVNLHTLLRIKAGKNHLKSSVDAAEAGLQREEAELREHLDKVRP